MDIVSIRKLFPLLKRRIQKRPVVYFDNAATSQKPTSVLKAMDDFYKKHNANVHRGLNELTQEATDMYEAARKNVASFINAKAQEIVFTSNATMALNMMVLSVIKTLKRGDRVLLTASNHHSLLVPWIVHAKEKGIVLDFVALNQDGSIDMAQLHIALRQPKTKVLAFTHVSNVLGNIEAVSDIVREAKQYGILTIVDMAQSMSHVQVDVQKIGCDVVAFSGHKMFGPTGIGVLWAKKEILETMHPLVYGGGMIKEVHQEYVSYADIPHRFEAGTPPIAEAMGLSAAIDFIKSLGWSEIHSYEESITTYLLQQLQTLPFIHILGTTDVKKKIPLVAFVMEGVHAHDVGDLLGSYGIVTRAGHHCTQLLHKTVGEAATVRVSLSIYNTKEEIDLLIFALKEIHQKFQK